MPLPHYSPKSENVFTLVGFILVTGILLRELYLEIMKNRVMIVRKIKSVYLI